MLALCPVPEDRRYEVWYGLQLNISRVRTQKSDIIREGMALHQSRGELSEHYFDSVCTDASEAADLQFEVNADREFEQSRVESRKRR